MPVPVAAQLREALNSVYAAGLDSSDEFIARAELALRDLEGQGEQVRIDLDKILGDWARLSAPEVNLVSLGEIRDSLNKCLKRANAAGLGDVQEAELCRRRAHNMIEDIRGQIRVFCRVRPLNEREEAECCEPALEPIDDMTLKAPQGCFSFDSVLAPGSQEDVFDECRDLVQSAVDGYNVTIFAYGQTGAGKTYTMYGSPEQPGVASRTTHELFRIIAGMEHRYAVTVTASMVEMYNNTLIDLLPAERRRGSSSRSPTKLSVRRDGANSVEVDQLAEWEAEGAADLQTLLDRGLAQRTVAANAMNIESSRSHLIFTIRVTTVDRVTRSTSQGKILLCDLGGSERLKKTESVGSHRKEAIEINKSLTALGNVIEAVARKTRQVPYREHKLTQIMQDSIGGSAKTLMFVNCSPAWSNASETWMSLIYAARAKKVTNLGAASPSSRTPFSPSGSPKGLFR